jgi:uncharacterized protein YciI
VIKSTSEEDLRAYFVVTTQFTRDEVARDRARPAHRGHLRKLYEGGVLLAAGPWLDNSGAIQIFAVDDEAELARYIRDDPYMAVGVVAAFQCRPWMPVLGGRAPASARSVGQEEPAHDSAEHQDAPRRNAGHDGAVHDNAEDSSGTRRGN